MKGSQDSYLPQNADALLLEIESLKNQLNFEAQQHKHWEELAMVFHDALWEQLKQA